MNTATAGDHADEWRSLLKKAYEEEIVGEAMYVRLQERAATDHERRTCQLLAELEAVTGRALLPLVEGYDVQCDEAAAWRSGEEYVLAWNDKDWKGTFETIIPLAENALVGMKRLRELGGDGERAALDQLVAHEEALLATARREVTGVENSLEPIEQYLAQHREAATPD